MGPDTSRAENPVNNAVYDQLDERWYTAQDAPVVAGGDSSFSHSGSLASLTPDGGAGISKATPVGGAAIAVRDHPSSRIANRRSVA